MRTLRVLSVAALLLCVGIACNDLTAPEAVPCALAETQLTPYGFDFPDGTSLPQVPVTAKETVPDCPASLGDTLFVATVKGRVHTYIVTWSK